MIDMTKPDKFVWKENQNKSVLSEIIIRSIDLLFVEKLRRSCLFTVVSTQSYREIALCIVFKYCYRLKIETIGEQKYSKPL